MAPVEVDPWCKQGPFARGPAAAVALAESGGLNLLD